MFNALISLARRIRLKRVTLLLIALTSLAPYGHAMSQPAQIEVDRLPADSTIGSCASVYEHIQFKGKVSWFCLDDQPSKVFTSGFANDTISSIKIPNGLAVKACENADGSGRCQTYFNSVNNVGHNLNDRFSHITLIRFNYDDFYMLIQSDPQYPWTCKSTSDGDCSNVTTADYNNQLQVDASNQLLQDLGIDHVAGTIINGDLTAFGHDWQLEAFHDFYVNKMNLNMYLGLGNHDYFNNLGDCTLKQSCTTRMMEYFINEVEGTLRPTAFDYQVSDPYYQFPSYRRDKSGSFAYSWDVGPIHFVQLNNFPTYQAQWNIWHFGAALRDYYDVQSALSWLETDLSLARERGQKIVLNYHDPSQHWNQNDAEFIQLLEDYAVSVVFAGHFHSQSGEFKRYNNSRQGVPVILAGGSDYQTFLLARFHNGELTVEKVDSTGGKDYALSQPKQYTLY